MMKKIFSAALWLLLLLVCLAGTTWAQDYVYAVGNPSFSVDIPIEDGYINVANGNIHLEIPISNVKQRGSLQHSSRLVYDSRIWKIIEDSSGNYSWQPNNVPNSMAGWRYVDGNDIGSVDYGAFQDTYISCGPNVTGYNTNGYGKFTYTDSSGTVHPFDSYIDSMVPSQCNNNTSETTSQLMTATDASGYNLIVTALNGYISTETVYDNSGNQVYPQLIDRNGNYASYDSHGNPINTSGIIPVTVSTAGNVTTYSVLIEGGQPIKYIVTTEPINVSTEFNESAVSENTSTITAIQSIQLPDGSMYSFTYDSGTSAGNYGELTSMTLPTGGKINIQYHPFIDSYQNNNRWIFTWQDEDGSKEFLQNVLSQCSSNSTDTGCQEQDLYRIVKSDTNVNDVVYTLTLNNGAWNTQTDIWNGASGYTGDTSGGKKVITILPQYNFSYPCPMSAGVPACNGSENVTQLSESVTLFDAPGGQLASLDKYTYDPSSGKPLQEQEWDYSSGAPSSIPIRQTNYVYASHVNNASLLTQKCSYFNGSLFSNTQYSYDQSSLLSSGATSQLESVGGPRGNLTSVSNQIFNYPGAAYSTSNACPLLSGAVATNSFIYDDAGMKRSMTDANGNTTIYNYACNDTFLKQTTYPNGQTVSITQDCFTGDPLSKRIGMDRLHRTDTMV